MRRVGRQQQHERLQDAARAHRRLRDLVDEGHHRRDRGVEIHRLGVLRHLLDRAVQQAHQRVRRRVVSHREVALLVEEEAPRARQEARYPRDGLRVPGLHRLQRAQEHLVEAQGIGAVLAHHVVRVHHVPARLAHLLGELFQLQLGILRVIRLLVAPDHLAQRHVNGVGQRAGLLHVGTLALQAHLLVGPRPAVGSVVAVGEAEDHPLVHQAHERLGRGNQSGIVEHLVPEARVEQVKHRVLGAAHVEVHRHPVLLLRRIPGRLVVLRIEVAEVVPARAGPLGHGVRLAPGRLAGLRVGCVHPLLDRGQGRLAGAGWLVALHLGQRNRELLLRQRHWGAVLAEDDGERLAPIALTREEPVAQAIVHGPLADALLLQPRGDLALGVRHGQAVDQRRVHQHPVADVGLLADVTALDYLDDRQIVRLRELIVALVVRGHGHDRAVAVLGEHVVGRPDGDARVVDGVHGIGAGEHAGLLAVILHAVLRALARGGLNVRRDFFAPVRRRNLTREGMLRRQHAVGSAEQRVGTRGEDGERLVRVGDAELDLGTG